MSAPGHPIDRLGDLVDGRLPADEAAELRRHLDGCSSCRDELTWIAAGRAAAMAARSTEPAPDALRARVVAALDGVDREPAATASRPARRAVLAGLAAAAVWLLYVVIPWPSPAVDIVEDARVDFMAVRDGTVVYDVRSSDSAELERYFNQASAGPRIRVIDLGMMGWALEGGRRTEIDGHPSALYAYRSADGARLACQMFEGRLADLQAPDQTRQENGFEFRIYTRAGVTLVFWQEGEIVCVLASDLPVADVVALATAKAMAPA